MKRQRYILYFLAGISILFSCYTNTSYPEVMRQADHCIVQHPDSALAYLSSLDSTIQQEPEETQMYHALLSIKAKDKLYITHTTDSLIRKIVRFYESYDDADKLMEAYYYLGSVYRDMNEAPHAIEAFQQAFDIGKDSKRDDILGRTYGQMGTLFAHQGMYVEAMDAYKKAYGYSLILNDHKGIVITSQDMARIFNLTNRPDSAIYYYGLSHKKAIEKGYKSIENNILIELGCIYVNQGKYDSAKIMFAKTSTIENDGNALLGLGEIHLNASRTDSATYYFNKAIQSDNINVMESGYLSLSKIEARKGNYPTALDYAYKSLELADSIRRITRTEAVSKIHSLYNDQRTRKENLELIKENEKRKIHIYQLALILLGIASMALWSFYYLKRKKEAAIAQEKKLYQLKTQQYANSLDFIEENKQKINELEDLLHQAKSQKDTLQKQLIQARKELLEISNQKIQTSRNEKELLELSFKKSDIYQYFHEIQNNENLKTAENKWTELRAAIDATYPNFTTQLYALYPQLSALELQICCLIKISTQVKDIARLVGRSTSAITASRIRLYKKIHGKEGTAEMMDQFITDL